MASDQPTYVFPFGKPCPITEADTARFMSTVSKGGGCWPWTGRRNHGGYGMFMLRRRTIMAHRFAFVVLRGPIPDGLVLDHLCRNRACVNPAHLEPVTQKINMLRSENSQAAKTECDSGHPFNEANTYIRPDGNRTCRTCHRASQQAYLKRRKAAAGVAR